MNEVIEIAGNKYRVAKKLSAMEQFHVTRRLGPALIVCGITFKMMMEGKEIPITEWAAVAGPVLQVVSSMSDEDVEYIINQSLKTCERESAGHWAPLYAPDGKVLMFEDMDMAEILRLTVEVLRENLVNFAKGMTVGGNSTEPSGA